VIAKKREREREILPRLLDEVLVGKVPVDEAPPGYQKSIQKKEKEKKKRGTDQDFILSLSIRQRGGRGERESRKKILRERGGDTHQQCTWGGRS